jgi:hypothetical protein
MYFVKLLLEGFKNVKAAALNVRSDLMKMFRVLSEGRCELLLCVVFIILMFFW